MNTQQVAPIEGPLTVRDDGEANFFGLLQPSGKWLARIQLNGELMPAKQDATIKRMATAFNAHDDLVNALRQARREIYDIGDERKIAPIINVIDAALAKAGAA